MSRAGSHEGPSCPVAACRVGAEGTALLQCLGRPSLHPGGSPMKVKVVLTFLAGLVVGLAVAAAAWHPRALGQGADKPPRWEYKVEVFDFDKDGSTKKLNQL